MIARESEKLEALRLVQLIRKDAGLTKTESRLLSTKMAFPRADLLELPEKILSKLRKSALELEITEYTTPQGKVLTLK
jgi:hypothetical protein